jgi:hypothetical protein
MRHPNMTHTIRRFFADAGSNSVRAFYDEVAGLGGYVFYVVNPKSSLNEDDTGRYFRFVTTCDVTIDVSEGTGAAAKILRPRPEDATRIERQFTNNEWFTGSFRGRLDRVAAVNIMEVSEGGSS